MPHDIQHLVSFKLTNQDLDDAFRRQEFQLVYQPQIATQGACIEGVEAFARWHHPTHGIIPPSLFLHFVESQGRSRELTNYLLRQSVPTAAKWSRANLDWKMTVNTGLADLVDGTLPLTIDILLREFQLDAKQLVIDIPESELVSEWDRKWPNVAATLKSLRDLGVGVALDCSGPQTLEIEQIDPEAFDILKVGGSALLTFTNGTKVLPFGFIARRLAFAKTHRLKTIAVGVEDNAMLLTLKKLGFDSLQGFVICKPVPQEQLADFRRTYVAPSLFIDAALEQESHPIEETKLNEKPTIRRNDVLEAKWLEASNDGASDNIDVVELRRKLATQKPHPHGVSSADIATPQSKPLNWLRSAKRRIFPD